MAVSKPAPVSEQLAFETSFLKLLLSIINNSKSFEVLHDFMQLRDLIYSPGEFGWTVLTDAVMRRRSGESFNSGPPAPPPPGGPGL